MQYSSVLLGFAAVAAALIPGSCGEPEVGIYMPARPGDVRSPCPMLNVLANHGFLPRDGKNINKTGCRFGMKHGLNLEEDFSDIMFDPAVLTNPLANQTTFNLDHLNRHNLLEHDGSLSRADAYWDNSQVFNETVYRETLGYFGNSSLITLKSAAAARMGRVMSSQASNPTFFLNATSEGISLGETAAYMLALGDRVTGTVQLDRVRMMFEEEKLPRELGWNATIPATAQDLFNLTQRIIENTNFPTNIKRRMHAGFHGGIVGKYVA